MADSTNYPRSFQSFTCPNESHDGFGHTFLFPALVEEKQRGHSSATNLIKSCLRKSGLAYHSLESLQLHSCLFHHCFPLCGSGFNGKNSVPNSNASFSTHDYFNAVLDEELGWFKYYKLMMPYVKLQLAVKIVACLEEFVISHWSKVTTPTHKQRTQIILLLTTTFELYFSIIYDFYPKSNAIHESDQSHDTTCSSDKSHNISYSSHFHSLCEQFCIKIAKCFEILLNELLREEIKRESECYSTLTKEDGDVVRYFIEISSLIMLAVNPFCSSSEIRDSLRQFLTGRVDQSHISNDLKTAGENSIRKGKQSHSISPGAVNGAVPKPKQVCIKRLRNTTDFSSEKTANEDCAEKNEAMKDSTETGVIVEGYDMSLSLLNILRQKISKKCFFRIVHYFSRGEDKIHRDFYNALSTIIDDKEHVRVGDHFINRQNLFSQVEKLLTDLTSGKKQVTDSHTVTLGSDNDDVSTLLTTLDVYPDRKQFNLSAAEEVLASGRQLSGKDDLSLVKRAMEEHIPGCYELITLGLQNSDFENWWNQGFLDLVLEKVEYFSTEFSVRQVLCVLYGLSKEEVICWGNIAKMTDLMTVMLRRLPSLLQERLILSESVKNKLSTPKEQRVVPDSSSHIDDNGISSLETPSLEESRGDWLCRLKGRKEVLKDVTTLLNRLTCDNVHQLLPEILMLCLYNKESVLTQALQVAIDNKGQVEPIVTLLRHMPGVCNMQDPDSGHLLVMECFGHIVSKTQFDERAEENTVKMLNLLTQGYNRLLDSDFETSQWCSDGVVSVNELMETLILPVLDRLITSCPKGVSESNITSQKESNGDIAVQLPISTIFHCFAALVQSTSPDRLHCLHGVVMVQALATFCVRHWSLFATADDSSGSSSGGEGGGYDDIWNSARNCLDSLMERLKTGEALDCTSVDWLLGASYHQDGLPSLVMVYPLLQQHSEFQMASLLGLLVKEMATALGEFSSESVLTTVLRLGQVNNAICETVTDYIETNDLLSTISITRPQLISVVAQLLSQSSTADMARTCCLLRSLVSRFFVVKEEVDQDLVDFIDWKALDRDYQIKCLSVQYMTDGLMSLASNHDSPSSNLTAVAVVNYQTACQTFLEGQTGLSSATTGQEELLVYTFVQCCSLLCHPQVSIVPKASQALHVLAMALLTHLSSALNREEEKGGGGRVEPKRKAVDREKETVDFDCYEKNKSQTSESKGKGMWRNEGRDGVGYYGVGHGKSGSVSHARGRVVVDGDTNEGERRTLGRGGGGGGGDEERATKEWLNLELFLSLRDVVVSVVDDSIGKQLELQLGKVWTGWVRHGGGGDGRDNKY